MEEEVQRKKDTRDEERMQSRGGVAEPLASTTTTAAMAVSGKENALLKVTEAHLAVLPDEDGDT